MNRIVWLLLAAALAYPGASTAQNASVAYPVKPVTWIVPTTAGGGLDVETRIYASKLGAALGRNVLVDNKPGAGSTMGAAYVAKAAPDGYTIVSLTPSHTISPLIYP